MSGYAVDRYRIESLKPKDKTCTVSDERVLYVEGFLAGGIVWRYRYWLNRKYEKLTLGKCLALENCPQKIVSSIPLIATYGRNVFG